VFLNSLLSSCGFVQVLGLSEEVGTESFVGVVQDAVLVGGSGGGGILSLELDLPDKVSALGSSSEGCGGLCLFVVCTGAFVGFTGVNSGHVEEHTEGVSVEVVCVVEQVV